MYLNNLTQLQTAQFQIEMILDTELNMQSMLKKHPLTPHTQHYMSAAQKEPVNSLQVINWMIRLFQVAAPPVWSAENHHENALLTSYLIWPWY